MPMKLETKGWLEMQNELKALQQAVRSDATRKAVRKGALVIGDAMYERAPVLDEKTAKSTALDSGALRDDIGVRMGQEELGYITARAGPGRRTRHVARFVEYGHRIVKRAAEGLRLRVRGGGVGRVWGEVRAYPFLRPAFEATWQASLSAFAEEMKTQLRKWVR